MEQMQLQATNVGTKIVFDQIVDAELTKRPFKTDWRQWNQLILVTV